MRKELFENFLGKDIRVFFRSTRFIELSAQEAASMDSIVEIFKNCPDYPLSIDDVIEINEVEKC